MTIAVDDKLPKIRVRGIRGAIEMAILHQRLEDPQTKPEADNVVKALAADLASDEDSMRNLARNLYEDPQVDLIWTLWYERDGGSDRVSPVLPSRIGTEPS
jgi:hypothetical protein